MGLRRAGAKLSEVGEKATSWRALLAMGRLRISF